MTYSSKKILRYGGMDLIAAVLIIVALYSPVILPIAERGMSWKPANLNPQFRVITSLPSQSWLGSTAINQS